MNIDTVVHAELPDAVGSEISSKPILSVNLLIFYSAIARHNSTLSNWKVDSIMPPQRQPDPHPDSPPREPDFPFTHPDDRPDETPVEQPPVEPSRQPDEPPWTPERGHGDMPIGIGAD